MIEAALREVGAARSIVVDEDGVILAGNATMEAAAAAGIERVHVVDVDGETIVAVRRSGLTPEQKIKLALFDNRTTDLSTWSPEVLQSFIDDGTDLEQFWFPDELSILLDGVPDEPLDYAQSDPEEGDTEGVEPRQTLADRFVVPPFSVLDARQGYWQSRKRAWLELGIQSEIGRGENTLGFSEGVNDRHARGEGPYAKASSAPGGSPRDAATLGANGKTQRGDGAGRPIGSDGNGPARRCGQDLMRGEHVVGGPRLTWVAGDRDEELMDETSRKNLTGGRRGPRPTQGHSTAPGRDGREKYTGGDAWLATSMHGRPPHGANVTQNTDGTLNYKPSNNGEGASGTSVFDPVLCELAYRWFCPPNGIILDPFAGGSVRGITAHKLGRRYIGIELSEPQIAANVKQAADMLPGNPPVWHVGDSRNVRSLVGQDKTIDFVFSCPPYADLEVYSDDPRDLSTMGYDAFLVAYREIIAASVSLLADDRFACFVVGDVRDRNGIYRNFISHTIEAFEQAGARLYNEAILVTAVGSLPIRVGRQFEAGRKLGKTHQNVLVFVKGDPKLATQHIGPVDVADVFADDPVGEVA